MQGKVLFALAVILTASLQGDALKCYSCLGSKSSECYQSKISSMVVDKCEQNSFISQDLLSLNSSWPLKPQCVNVVLKSGMGIEEPHVIKGCGVSYDNKSVCELIQEVLPVERCQWCDDKELCNNF